MLLLIVLPALGQRVELLVDEGDKVKNPPEVVTLEYKFEMGELRRYDVTVTGEGLVKLPGQNETAKLQCYTSMTFVQHAKSQSEADGTWKMEWDMIKAVMNIPEFGDMCLTIPPVDYEMDKYGTVTKLKGLDNLPVSPGLPQNKIVGDVLGQIKFLGFPHKGLRVDDEWTDKYTVKVAGQDDISVATKSKIVGFEHIKNWDCVKILTTYETPFSLKISEQTDAVKTTDKAVPGGSEETASADAGAKPVTLKGTEKAQMWTYFAYAEGKLIQTVATTELMADIEGLPAADTAPKAESKPVEKTAAEQAKEGASTSPPAPDLQVELPKHDVYVKYQMISKFNPDLPKHMEEIKE